jgi:hypothetical protein
MSEQQTNDVPWWRNDPWLGRHLWRERRLRFPLDELAKYSGLTVAWYPDGSGIRDAAEDRAVLWERFKALGEDPSWYMYEFIDPPA